MRAAAERLLALWEEPQDLALVVAIGCVLGTFPVYGVPTLLCIIAARALRAEIGGAAGGEQTHYAAPVSSAGSVCARGVACLRLS